MTVMKTRRAVSGGLLAALCAPAVARAGPTNRFGPYQGLQNRLNERFLLAENGRLVMASEQGFYQSRIGWHADLVIVDGSRRVRASDGPGYYVRLRAAAMDQKGWPTQELGALHIENGAPEVGPVGEGWWSAQWVAEDVYNGGRSHPKYYRFRNRWKPDQYLRVEGVGVDVGPIRQGSWPSVWRYNG